MSNILEEHLKEQVLLLQEDLRNFSLNEIYAKRIAVSIRTLVHDTHKSSSLLNQLNKKNILFYDTNAPIDSISYWSGNFSINGWNFSLLPYIGIVGKEVRIENNVNCEIKYFPIYIQWQIKRKLIAFDEWWNMKIYDNRDGYSLTRKELVLSVVNKDGGVHIDELKENYKSFKSNNLFKFKFNGKTQGTDNIPMNSAIAQIGWELAESINDKIINQY